MRELRIAAELTDTGSGFRIWSQQWHRAQQQVLAVQEQIAAEVLEALDVRFAGIRLERAARPRQPRSADAYDHYLRGRALFMEGRRTTYYEARRHYKAALDIDPEYALAYAGLADCLSYLYLFHELSESHRVSAEEASAKAIELAPEVAESHAARALAFDTYARDDEAEHHFRRALELDPKSFEASYHFARHCFRRGRFEEALELFRRAADADPTAYAPCDLAAGISVSLGDHSGGAAWRQQCLERVERRLERYPGDQRAILFGGVGLAAQGDKKRALRWLRRAEEIDPEDPVALYNMACAATLCDEVDLGLDFLERAIAAGFPDLSWIESDSELDPLRSAPRYADVIAPLRERERESRERFTLVPEVGFEPTSLCQAGDFKSPASAVPPLRRLPLRRRMKVWRRRPDSNRRIRVLQTLALPLGHVALGDLGAGFRAARLAWSGKRDSNPRPQPWQGCALPLSYSRAQANPPENRQALSRGGYGPLSGTVNSRALRGRSTGC